jgi:hypothetical protein
VTKLTVPAVGPNHIKIAGVCTPSGRSIERPSSRASIQVPALPVDSPAQALTCHQGDIALENHSRNIGSSKA